MKKPLERCVNGCDAPVQPPSWVLCKACFETLDKKMESLADKVFGNTRAERRPAGEGGR